MSVFRVIALEAVWSLLRNILSKLISTRAFWRRKKYHLVCKDKTTEASQITISGVNANEKSIVEDYDDLREDIAENSKDTKE